MTTIPDLKSIMIYHFYAFPAQSGTNTLPIKNSVFSFKPFTTVKNHSKVAKNVIQQMNLKMNPTIKGV
jgi:hypothetical protein